MNQLQLGKKIQELRKLKGLTQEELADRTSLSTRTIQRIENGEVDARTYTLGRLAEALNIELDILLIEDESNNTFFSIDSSRNATNKYLALFHLSGLFILIIPPILFWIIKRDDIPGIKEHAKDILNFQISITIYLLVSMVLLIIIIGLPLLIFLGIFSSVVIIVNTFKVLRGDEYKYPFNMNIIKKI